MGEQAENSLDSESVTSSSNPNSESVSSAPADEFDQSVAVESLISDAVAQNDLSVADYANHDVGRDEEHDTTSAFDRFITSVGDGVRNLVEKLGKLGFAALFGGPVIIIAVVIIVLMVLK